MLPRVLPFVILLIGVMIALYGGYATPSETAGLGAVLALVLIAVVYGVWRPKDYDDHLHEYPERIDNADVHHRYVASLLLRDELPAHQPVGGRVDSRDASIQVGASYRHLDFRRDTGFFSPPVSIILMTTPIILPPLKASGFDLVWFGVVMTIVMEMGLIHPPVGLNIFIIKSIAPDIPLGSVIMGILPFIALMLFAVILLCFFPGIATWFPDLVMGVVAK